MGVTHASWVYRDIVAKVIQVRNVPDEVHRQLRQRAAAAGVALSDYVLDELKRIASRGANAEVLMRAASRPDGVSRRAMLDALDEGRVR